MTPEIDVPSTAHAAGQLDERFVLDARVAARPWGDEYRAHHALFGSPVTVFLMDPRRGGTRGDSAAICAAAARAQQMRLHPHLARVFEVGVELGSIYVVEEPLNGPSLAEWMDRGPVAAGDATRVARQLVDGLRFAHRSGIAHGALAADLVTMVGISPPFAMIRGFGSSGLEAAPAHDVRALLDLLRPLLGDTFPPTASGAVQDEALARFDAALAATERARGRLAVLPRVEPLLVAPFPPQRNAAKRRPAGRWFGLGLLLLLALLGGRQCASSRPPSHARTDAPAVPLPPAATSTRTTVTAAVAATEAPSTTTLPSLTWGESLPADGGTLVARLGVPLDFVARLAHPAAADAQRWFVDGVEAGQGPTWQFVAGSEHAGRALRVQSVVERDGVQIEHQWSLQVEPAVVHVRRHAPASERPAISAPRIVAASPGAGGVVMVSQGAALRFGVDLEGAPAATLRWWLDGRRLAQGRVCRLHAAWPVGSFHHLEVEVRGRAGEPGTSTFWSLQVMPAS